MGNVIKLRKLGWAESPKDNSLGRSPRYKIYGGKAMWLYAVDEFIVGPKNSASR